MGFIRNANPRGILRKEVSILIKKNTISYCLSAAGVIAIANANEAAEKNFGGDGRYAITDKGYLVTLPERMAVLPHPFEKLVLRVGDCPSLARLDSYMHYDFIEKKCIDSPPIHLHRSDGSVAKVDIHNILGIRLPSLV